MRHIFRQGNGRGFLTYVPWEFLHHFVRKDMVGLHVHFSLCSVVSLPSLPDSNGTISTRSGNACPIRGPGYRTYPYLMHMTAIGIEMLSWITSIFRTRAFWDSI